MNHTKIIHEQIMRSLIMEGGNAVPDVSRIKKCDIQKTINDFKRNILSQVFGEKLNDEDIFLLGSTGKKPDSGDIDLAIDANKIEGSVLYNLLKLNETCASNGFVSCINTINYKMLHVSYPQKGYKNKNVQIDVLFTYNPSFTKFFMFSPSNKESKYKGAHRNEILHSISKIISYEPIYEDKQGNILKWKQNDIMDNGYFKVTKTLIDASGNRLKYKSTDEDLEERICFE